MTLETETQYDQTRVFLQRFENTVALLLEMRQGKQGNERSLLETEISSYESLIDDLRRQLDRYEAERGRRKAA